MKLPMTEVVLNTPHFVLMNGSCRIGPNILPLYSGIECSPIYGFSNKVSYDKFCLRSQQALTPYPMVKGFLRHQVESADVSLKLVVIDAVGIDGRTLQAATMEAVLEAQENTAIHITAKYRLVFDRQADAYRIEEACV